MWMLDYYPLDVEHVNDDGSVEATMSFGTLEWMARLVLGFGEGVRVLHPPETGLSKSMIEPLRRSTPMT